MNNNNSLQESIREIEDQFSISLQYYKLNEVENGNKHLFLCLQLINSMQISDIDINELKTQLLTRVDDLYKNETYTIYVA